MIGGILGILALVAVHYLVKWWEDEHIDSSSAMLSGNSTEAEVNRASDERKRAKRQKLEAEVRRLNEEHPNRMFYRDGPRIKEYSEEEAEAIRECERLNAPYKPSYPHYRIRYGRVEYAQDLVHKYKYEAKMREINRAFENGIQCKYDHLNMKLINKVTGEEIPFDPDSFDLPLSCYRGYSAWGELLNEEETIS